MAPISVTGSIHSHYISALSNDHTTSRLDGLSPRSTSSQTQTASIAIGASVGFCLLLAIISLILCIRHTRKRHQRFLADLEDGAAEPTKNSGKASRLTSEIWSDALDPDDSLDPSDAAVTNGKRKRVSGSPAKEEVRRSKRISLRPWKHLSSIPENPKNSQELSPTEAETEEGIPLEAFGSSRRETAIYAAEPAEEVIDANAKGDGHGRSESPLPEVLPSFAIGSAVRYGEDMAADGDKRKVVRSASTGVLRADGTVFGYPGFNTREGPHVHTRSISLGAPLTRPPSGPLPPVPVIPPLTIGDRNSFRNGVVVALSNSSSMNSFGSVGSSVLVASPLLKIRDDGKDAPPREEEESSTDDDAEQIDVSTGPRQSQRIIRPRRTPTRDSPQVTTSRPSARTSTTPTLRPTPPDRPLSDSSTTSGESAKNRFSIPQIGTADRISISRVSSTTSLHGSRTLQTIETPIRKRPQRRSQVSAAGSPAERARKTAAAAAVLRDSSGNAGKGSPLRQVCITPGSGRSSKSGAGHARSPSNWSPTRVSAMKGSPNARQSPRRHSVVRISTLTPQVLGRHSRSGSGSPPRLILDRIREECESEESGGREAGDGAAVGEEGRQGGQMKQSRQIARESRLHAQTMRGSYTPSSRPQSIRNAAEEHADLPSDPSNSTLTGSPTQRAASRLSDRSSLMISQFPSPCKAAASVALCQRSTGLLPQFSWDTENSAVEHSDYGSSSPPDAPVQDEHPTPSSAENDSLGDLSPVSPMDMPSTLPMSVSAATEYDPTWPMLLMPAPPEEYDPASPPVVWDGDEPERLSWLFPFEMRPSEGLDMTTKSRPSSVIYTLEESPCSPKTIPDARERGSERREKLTSHNASSVMARLPQDRMNASRFLGTSVPVLPPPQTGLEDLYEVQYRPQSHLEPGSVQYRLHAPPTRTARPGPPAPGLPTVPQHNSPAHMTRPQSESTTSPPNRPARQTPHGPRSAPAKSILRNVSALRRMNSDVQPHMHRESRNFVRLGREASPLLPWAGTPDLSREASSNGFWDVNGNATTGAERAADEVEGVETKAVDFDFLSRSIERALGVGAVDRLSGVPVSATPCPAPRMRESSVWVDGEKYWGGRPGSRRLPMLDVVSTDAAVGRSGRMDRTVDHGSLSTPIDRIKRGSEGTGGFGTPKSLYDGDGFLKT